MSRVPPSFRDGSLPPPAGGDSSLFVWPCGCVTSGSRTGPLVQDCGDQRCYRRTAPAVRRLSRSDRRRLL